MTTSEYQPLVEFLTGQFTGVERHFAAIDQHFAAIDRRFDAHDERFREILGHLEAIYGRLERLEQEYYAVVEGIRRIEALLMDERARREMLERGLAELKERVTLLQVRIDEMKRRLRSS